MRKDAKTKGTNIKRTVSTDLVQPGRSRLAICTLNACGLRSFATLRLCVKLPYSGSRLTTL